MASSRVTSPPVSLKDRIAALEKKKNTNGAQSTSPPPTSPPARSLSPTGNVVPANNVNNLRDKITKFEKKGGTPIPRGSFGLGAPPPDIPGAPKRKGELYGNRVPGLDRPTHAPVVTRSITAPLRPQMTGGDVIGLRPQMTGADPSYLRPQFTGDAVMRRAVSSYEPGGSSHSGDGEMQSYAPFVPPTSPPSDSNELLPNVQDLSEAVGVSSDPTSSTRSADRLSTTNQGVSSPPDGPQTTAFEETDTSAEAASHRQEVPTVQLTQAPEALQPTSSAPEAKAELKSQGSAETLREATASPDRKAVKSSLTTDNTPSARVASTSERDSLELDNVGDRSTASIDLQDVSIITITQPQVYLTSSVPRSVVVEPSPPSSRPQSRTERSPKPAQRSTTQYEAPKPTSYVEPEFDVPKSPPPSKSTFTAVVHRRTTVQNNERPATTFETAAGSSDAPEVEPAATLSPAPRVPVQTVTDSEVSFSAEDLGSLLADAALLEEALNLGPVSTPKKDVFPHVSLASTLSAVPQDVYNQGKHSRTGSQMTIKALEREDSPSVAEPKASSSASVGKASAPAKAVAPSPPNVIVAKPEPVTISDFSDFGFQELIAPSEIGRFSAPEIGDEIPPTPPPKSPPSSYLSSMRSSAAKRMSSLLPEGPRHSVSSSEDSAPVTTPPSNDLDVQVTRSPRHSKSYNALRDDTSQKSRSTGGGDDLSFVSHESKRSKWSFKSSSKSSKGLSRASTFADRIWPGSSKRKTSNNNVEEPPEVPPLAQSASLGSKPKSTQRLAADSPPQLPPSPSVLESGSSRPVSWLSEASSALSSPGFDDQFFDQFPSVPPESGSSTQQSLGTPPSNNSKVGLDGTLLTPPDRGSSLSHMFSSSRQR